MEIVLRVYSLHALYMLYTTVFETNLDSHNLKIVGTAFENVQSLALELAQR